MSGAGALLGRVGVAVVAAAVGFLLVSQLRAQNDVSQQLEAESETDLTAIFARLNEESASLREEITDLRIQLTFLETSAEQEAVARAAAESELAELQILAGTVGARGPGVVVSVQDPDRLLEAADLLDLVQELRDAGAEAIAVDDHRVGAATSFGEDGGRVTVDGEPLPRSFELVAIGDPGTLEGGLAIRGGAIELLEAESSVEISVARRTEVSVPPLR